MALTLDEASKIVDVALAKAAELKLNPMAVAVLDAGGHLLAFKRDERAGVLRPEIAIGKAWGCVGMGVASTRIMETRYTPRPSFLASLIAMSGGNIVPVAGGLLIKKAGEIVGAVGVTGDTSDNDEVCALAGVQAAGLEATP